MIDNVDVFFSVPSSGVAVHGRRFWSMVHMTHTYLTRPAEHDLVSITRRSKGEPETHGIKAVIPLFEVGRWRFVEHVKDCLSDRCL
jgi:hypothetical protein